jgi:RsiW-degrading membrane proteinase PrsW (M82 family)
MQCPQCGATVVATAHFCPVCGQAIAAQHPTPIAVGQASGAATIHEATTMVMQRAAPLPFAGDAQSEPSFSAADAAAIVANAGKAMVVSQWQRWWWKILIVGVALYGAVNNVTFSTDNIFLLPQLFMIGTFLVPIVYTAYLYEDGTLYDVPLSKIALVFFFGGVIGCLVASVLLARFIPSDSGGLFGSLSLSSALIVGVCEELAKLVVVLPFLALARRSYPTVMHGLVLGAAAGMGFAAFESMGYAFLALIVPGGGLEMMHDTIRLRALLAPLGHGTWTAIIAAALWRERIAGRFPLTVNVLITYLLAVLLHALWDFLPPLRVPGLGLPLTLLALGVFGLLLLRFFLLVARGNGGYAYQEPNLALALRLYFGGLRGEMRGMMRKK